MSALCNNIECAHSFRLLNPSLAGAEIFRYRSVLSNPTTQFTQIIPLTVPLSRTVSHASSVCDQKYRQQYILLFHWARDFPG